MKFLGNVEIKRNVPGMQQSGTLLPITTISGPYGTPSLSSFDVVDVVPTNTGWLLVASSDLVARIAADGNLTEMQKLSSDYQFDPLSIASDGNSNAIITGTSTTSGRSMKTSDGGITWTPFFLGANSLAVVWTGQRFLAGQNLTSTSRIYSIEQDLSTVNITTLVSPQIPQIGRIGKGWSDGNGTVIFVSGSNFIRSTDHGETWTSGVFPYAGQYVVPQYMAQNGTGTWVGVMDSPYSPRGLISTDNGATWTTWAGFNTTRFLSWDAALNRFYICTNGGWYRATSVDGVNWVQDTSTYDMTTPQFNVAPSVNSVALVHNVFSSAEFRLADIIDGGATGELQTLNFEKLEQHPQSDLVAGRVYYNTSDDYLYVYDGTVWKQISTGSIMSQLTELSDVNVTSPANRQLLVHDGTEFVNQKIHHIHVHTDHTDNTISINHGLNQENVYVQVFDDSVYPPVQIIPDAIEITDANNIVVTLSTGMLCTVNVIGVGI